MTKRGIIDNNLTDYPHPIVNGGEAALAQVPPQKDPFCRSRYRRLGDVDGLGVMHVLQQGLGRDLRGC